ncbi:hypothetical protein O1M63_39855 [Streptomyces mirabilis]|nr:hypothetical protein [Streptomyces mirabilis]
MVNGPVVHGMDRTLGSRQLAALLSAVPHADGRPGYRALADGVRRLPSTAGSHCTSGCPPSASWPPRSRSAGPR